MPEKTATTPETRPGDQMTLDQFLRGLDDSTEILEAARDLLKQINQRPGKTSATASELAAALNTQIVVEVVASQLDYLRDPEHYFEEEYRGE